MTERILIALIAIAASLGVGYWWGKSDADTKWGKRFAEMEALSAKKLAEATDAVRKVETEASERLNDLASKHAKEIRDAKVRSDRIVADIRSGALRMSIPVASACPSPEAQGAAPAGGDRPQARAELAAEAAGTLVSIASEGDEAIRQLNACIDAYNEVRAKFNEKQE
jgi:prophage endopeptidase